MRVRRIVVFAVVFAAVTGMRSFAQGRSAALHWQPWSNAVFAQAKAQHKFVLLDLEAVWCHWCHVMDDVTYRDPNVVRLLNEKYILVKVDQDSRPDISNRYQDYGWPATVVFAADGSEIAKLQGYLPPRRMASLLQAVIDDPTPGPSVQKEAAFHPADSSTLQPAVLMQVRADYEAQYDTAASGWGFGHKYLDRDSVEYAMRLAARGNAVYATRAAETLHDATALIDPVWGGMYQYSVDGNWHEPHFEKLISVQADALREYSLAYAQTQNREDLTAAQDIARYVSNFLSDKATGVFFVSQDADLHDGQENAPYFKLGDDGRRAQGIPRVDKHVYARENGWMITSFCNYYAASGDAAALDKAQRAAQWIVQHRSLPGGGFRHDDVDRAGPYLGDTLAMGQAFLALYNVSGDRADLQRASAAAQYITAHFEPISPGTGFVTSATRTNAAYPQHADRDENIALVRFASLVAFATGDARYRATAADAMRYLAAPSVARQPMAAGTLLADQDSNEAPIHVTIVGLPSDPQFGTLHAAALRSIASHELIELRDPAARHPLPTDISYPKLSRPALFLCTARACSSPVFQPQQVRAKIQRAQEMAR